ncbi:hypothetical protein L1279_000507 [Planomicrobium sp. HSC-17F08]|nr:hypothetical protein [Planomicrobium sp. HSC-17F08]
MTLETVNSHRLIKEYKIETKENNNMLVIFQGNILKDESDIIGISIYNDEEGKGDLYNAFQNLSGADYLQERKLLASGNGWTSLASSDIHSQTVMYIYSNSREGEQIQSEEYHAFLRMTFASLNSFIYEGNNVTTVALPVLFRKGINKPDYINFIHLFVYEASKFLRKNKSIETLKIYIWHEEDARIWLETLNEKLQHSFKGEMGELKLEILSKLLNPFYEKIFPNRTIRKVETELKKKETNFQQLAFTCWELINVIVERIVLLPDMPELPSDLSNANSFKKVRSLKKQRYIVEWFADYLLNILEFSNYTRMQSPSASDKYHYLLLLNQVLAYYEEMEKTVKGEARNA